MRADVGLSSGVWGQTTFAQAGPAPPMFKRTILDLMNIIFAKQNGTNCMYGLAGGWPVGGVSNAPHVMVSLQLCTWMTTLRSPRGNLP